MSVDQTQRLFLLVMGFGLVPVALSYGVIPEESLPLLYDIADPDLSTRHIFRAVMGLYFGMICFWLVGAFLSKLRIAALWTVFVFVTGIASGRVLSMVLDGWPQPLLVFYLFAEIGVAAASWYLIIRAPNHKNARNV